MNGDYITDDVQIADLVLSGLTMGLATNISSTSGLATALTGVGYSYRESDETLAQEHATYRNFPEALVNVGGIESRLYSLFLNDWSNHSPASFAFGC